MKIEDYLISHPLINAYSIEKALGMPIGTIRKGKHIPEKYHEAIAGLLSAYGYGSGVVKEKPVEVIRQATGMFTRLGKGGSLICHLDVIVKPVQDIPDNTPVTLG